MPVVTPELIGITLFIVFFLLLLVGCPIMVALGLATMTCFVFADLHISIMIEKAFAQLTAFPLMALPCFVLAGALMEASGISRRLVHIAERIVGPIPGGLAISTTLSCVFFGAISGSGPATTAAVGMLMIPAMSCKGYDKGYAAAATATAGGIGIVIPPSIPMVIYGVTAQQSISDLFMGGIIPGLFIAFSLVCMHAFLCRNMPKDPEQSNWSLLALHKAMVDGIWSVLAPIVILGGIYTGMFTPTEAAVVAIMYTVFVGLFIHRELKFQAFLNCLKTTTWLTGRVLVLVFTAAAFGYLLTIYQLPKLIAEWMLALSDNVYVIWFLVVTLLIFLGMFIETLALIMLVTPVLLPVMMAFGVNPIHFGVVLVCCCGVGFSTPPLGENMFVASGIADISLEEISLKALPLVAVNLIAIAMLVMFPQITLWLPGL